MTTNDQQPVILLSPAPRIKEQQQKQQRRERAMPSPTLSISTSFKTLSRKLSSLSLRSSPPSPRPGLRKEPTSACTTDNNGFLLLPNNDDHHSIKTTSSTNSSTLLSPISSTCTTPTTSAERALPSVLLQDKYRDHKKGKSIGSGATAKLRLLEPIHGNKKTIVAIKTFRKRDTKDETRRGYDKRMTSEFCISKTLCHQHVVQVFDLLKDKKGRWCTVMEYVRSSLLCHHIMSYTN